MEIRERGKREFTRPQDTPVALLMNNGESTEREYSLDILLFEVRNDFQ